MNEEAERKHYTYSASSRNRRTLYMVMSEVGLDEIMIMGAIFPVARTCVVNMGDSKAGGKTLLTILLLSGIGIYNQQRLCQCLHSSFQQRRGYTHPFWMILW